MAEAFKYGKLLFRKLDEGKISYYIAPTKYVEAKEAAGFAVEFDCDYFDYPPFLYKHLPFNPVVLNKTCGDADYEYYVE